MPEDPLKTIVDDNEYYCYYSDLPSPLAYEEESKKNIVAAALTVADMDRVIEMAWEDRTPFEAIYIQFGLSEQDVKRIMRTQLKLSSYKMWRKRVHDCNTKNGMLRSKEINRFKCSRQRIISLNKISKR
jgi:uncharacterized protein (TIGR03643 family)